MLYFCRKGKMPRPKPESVGISSRGVHRQPSIKYTRDPQMQPYFPMMCNVPSQPLNKNRYNINKSILYIL